MEIAIFQTPSNIISSLFYKTNQLKMMQLISGKKKLKESNVKFSLQT